MRQIIAEASQPIAQRQTTQKTKIEFPLGSPTETLKKKIKTCVEFIAFTQVIIRHGF